MERSRFDALTRWLATRRSRRTALSGAGVGLAALSFGRVSAQDATPAAADQAERPAAKSTAGLLFVQNAGASSLEPGSSDIHTLTLTGTTAQTLYFSDRPSRFTGTLPTSEFVETFGDLFGDDPPNATLIGHTETGTQDEDAIVLELMTPQYDATSATVVYDVRVLGAEAIGDRAFEQEPLTALDTARDYSEVHLFIDDAAVDCGGFCTSPLGQLMCYSTDAFNWHCLECGCYNPR